MKILQCIECTRHIEVETVQDGEPDEFLCLTCRPVAVPSIEQHVAAVRYYHPRLRPPALPAGTPYVDDLLSR